MAKVAAQFDESAYSYDLNQTILKQLSTENVSTFIAQESNYILEMTKTKTKPNTLTIIECNVSCVTKKKKKCLVSVCAPNATMCVVSHICVNSQRFLRFLEMIPNSNMYFSLSMNVNEFLFSCGGTCLIRFVGL